MAAVPDPPPAASHSPSPSTHSRKRSPHFPSEPPSQLAMANSPPMSHDQHQTESSADEVTPIIHHEHGPRREYRTTEPDALAPGNRSAAGSIDDDASGLRRRQRGSANRGRSGASSRFSDEEPSGWWKRQVDKYGSVELDNKGSVARDHLALERTFLAWLRTSLAFASIGIGIAQLFRLNTAINDHEGLTPEPTPPGVIRLREVGKPLGATFLGIAIVVLAVGWRRYFESQYWIIRGKFPASRGSILLVTFVAAGLILVSLVLVSTVDPTEFQPKT